MLKLNLKGAYKMNDKNFTWKEFMDDLINDTKPLNIETSTPTEEYMKKVMQNHIDAINNKSTKPTSEYYADNIIAEDPNGTRTFKGKKEIFEEFPKMANVSFIPQKAELVAPISASYGNSSAMAFKLYAQVDGHDITIDIIETMSFNNNGQITEIMAYWGKENVTLIN
ncbi:hypothetical protein M3663_00730 [Staphylococcus xylosus]|nr:nuclear transport factor 2 family protein [Staphylococcus xylosus]MCE7786549.1 hypothetical protein [Staphylococcus xylosus]MCM3517467.1 hypothetical protein [Staphylococcus xylosus]UBV33617.1 nuclear transport factor 2 family protein [Staphylococcus xylosus]UBV36317.1 nuclear transport factor 2 family protein [Staphylococcus xylosus]